MQRVILVCFAIFFSWSLVDQINAQTSNSSISYNIQEEIQDLVNGMESIKIKIDKSKGRIGEINYEIEILANSLDAGVRIADDLERYKAICENRKKLYEKLQSKTLKESYGNCIERENKLRSITLNYLGSIEDISNNISSLKKENDVAAAYIKELTIDLEYESRIIQMLREVSEFD